MREDDFGFYFANVHRSTAFRREGSLEFRPGLYTTYRAGRRPVCRLLVFRRFYRFLCCRFVAILMERDLLLLSAHVYGIMRLPICQPIKLTLINMLFDFCMRLLVIEART